MKRFTLIFFLMVLLALAVPGAAAQAQEGLTVTVPGGGGDSTGGLPIHTFWELMGVMVAFFGGLVFTLLGIAQGIKMLRNDPVQMSIIEQAFKSVPSDVVQIIQDGSRLVIEAATMVKEVGEFLKEATDGVPAKDKSPFIDDPNAQG